MHSDCVCCGDKLTQIVEDRLLEGGVDFDCCHEDCQVSFELMGEVRDGDVVFREFLFRVDKVLEMFGNELFERVKRNEGRLDVVGLVVLSGHSERGVPEWCGRCSFAAGRDEREPLVGEGELPGVVRRRYA